MKNYYVCIAMVFFALCGLTTQKAQATHLAGADLTYRWLGGSSYEVTLKLYRDCYGVAAPTNPNVHFESDNCNIDFDENLEQVGPGTEITFPCANAATACSGGSQQGYQQYIYKDTVNLSACSDWVLSWEDCCRNCAITTIVHSNDCSSDPGMYVNAHLNNLNGGNSSPVFTNLPVALLCVGQSFTYNHGVVDADGDVLVYSLVAPLQSAGNPVVFEPGFSATNPISSNPALSLNTSSGDLNLTPTQFQVGVLAIRVEEYRNGVKVGDVVRDMQFLVRNCNNTLPTASGIDGTNSFETSICAGTQICFDINSDDQDQGQVVDMDWNAAIAGATFSASGTPHPTGTFCWTPGPQDAREAPYVFTVTVRDDACPQNGLNTYSYTIYVPMGLNLQVTNPSCGNAAGGAINLVIGGGEAPYQTNWSNGATSEDLSGLGAGTFTVTVVDANGCSNSASATLVGGGVSNIKISITGTKTTCSYSCDGTLTANATLGIAPYSYLWSDGQTTKVATGLCAGTYTVTVTDKNGCTSAKSCVVKAPAAVKASFTAVNVKCKGSATGSLTANPSGGTAGYTYLWSNGETTKTISGLVAGTYTVTVTDSKGCTGSGSKAVTEPAKVLAVSATKTNASHCNPCNGTATANPTGGVAPYTYLWSNGQTTKKIISLCGGSYSVVVTDKNGCSANCGVSLTGCAPSRIYNETSADLVSLYPNPFSENFTVTFAGSESFDVKIFDIKGTMVADYKNNIDQVEIGADLQSGLYMIYVSTESGYFQSIKALKAE